MPLSSHHQPRLTTLLRLSAATTALLGLSITALITPLHQVHAMSSSSSPTTTTTTLSPPSQPPGTTPHPYTPRNPPPSPFPYPPSAFTRADPNPDTQFYASPRYVTHIDDAAIASLKRYYTHALPRTGRILDFCSSWISHFPRELEEAATATTGGARLEVDGFGMSAAELARNAVLSKRVVRDLNAQPDLSLSLDASEDAGKYDAATCVVSIDYLTSPLAVLSSLRARTKPGGAVHLVISNRCFPTKAVRRWLEVGERERLEMVGDYLWWSGWRDVEILDLKEAEEVEGAAGAGAAGGEVKGLQGLMGWFGMGGGHRDPLWVVRGVNPGGSA